MRLGHTDVTSKPAAADRLQTILGNETVRIKSIASERSAENPELNETKKERSSWKRSLTK